MPALPLLLGLLLAGPPVAADTTSLTALAASSARPSECAPRDPRRRGKKISVWSKARTPELVPYCDLVARAQVLLESDAKGALELANQADAVWPRHAGALALRGRAEVALGKTKEALESFTQARALDPQALDDPRALRAFGRALVANGKLEEGAEVYRTLVPRSALVPEVQRVAILLEAALAVTAVIGAKEDPVAPLATRLAEPLAFLDEARASKSGALAAEVALAQALLFDRAGDPIKSAGALAAVGDGTRLDLAPFVADPSDAHALRGLALESSAPEEARRAWASYLAASTVAPYVERAKARVAALGGKKPAKGKGR